MNTFDMTATITVTARDEAEARTILDEFNGIYLTDSRGQEVCLSLGSSDQLTLVDEDADDSADTHGGYARTLAELRAEIINDHASCAARLHSEYPNGNEDGDLSDEGRADYLELSERVDTLAKLIKNSEQPGQTLASFKTHIEQTKLGCESMIEAIYPDGSDDLSDDDLGDWCTMNAEQETLACVLGWLHPDVR